MAGESFKGVSSKAGRCNKKPVPIVECFAFCSGTTFFRWGVTLGLQPQTLPEGIIPSDSLLPLRGEFKGFSLENVGYSANPFQLQNVSRSALKLRYLIVSGYVRAAALRPA